MNQIVKLNLIEAIANKRFQLVAVLSMAYHPAKRATIKRLDVEIDDLQKQLRMF